MLIPYISETGFDPVTWYKKIMEEFKMAYKITEDCVSCGSCADTCPVSAIAEGDNQYVINPDDCVSCGSCAEACPVSAIVEE